MVGLLALGACTDRAVTVTFNNEDPEVSIAWPTAGTELPSNTEVTLVALAADPETATEELTLSWTSSQDGPLTGDGYVWVGEQASLRLPSGISDGPHTLTVRVADEDGATAEAMVDVVAVPNQPPQVAFVTPNPDETLVIRTQDQFRMSLTVSDDADTPGNLDVVWSGSLADATPLPPVFNADGSMGVTLPQLAEGTYSAAISVRDRYGAEGFAQTAFTVVVDDDNDGVAADDDCDDNDPNTYPGAVDICDGEDNDCDGIADNNPPQWYLDSDGDQFGSGASVPACEAPNGYVADGSDCDDADAAQFPGAIELCNGEDDDCDGDIDEQAADAVTWYADVDNDGYGDADAAVVACEGPTDAYIRDDTDCDDAEPTAYPGADELCDGIDNDCDDQIDESPPTWFADVDGDGWGDDTDFAAQCDPPSADHVSRGGDCSDTEPGIHPDATEVCNGRDDDCNGEVDDSETEGLEWYTDADGDGFGDPDTVVVACARPDGAVERPFDCDDNDPERRPGADELCNELDDDCDGQPENALWVGEGHPYDLPQTALNAAPSGGLVCVDAGMYDGSLNYGGRSVRVQGVDRDQVFLMANAGVTFNSAENQEAVLSDVTVQNNGGSGSSNRGMTIAGASPIIRRVRFTGYRTNGRDAVSGILITNSGAVLQDVEVDDFEAYQGDINGESVVAGIRANNWSGSASGLSIHDMRHVRFPSPTIYQFSYGEGLALHISGGSDVFLQDVSLYANVGTSPRGEDGTLFVRDSTVVVERLAVYDNRLGATTINGEGGGLFIRGTSDVDVRGGFFGNNRVNGSSPYGGAISIIDGNLTLTNVDIVGNSVSGSSSAACGGGGIARIGSGVSAIELNNVSLFDNEAICSANTRGGAFYTGATPPTLTVSYSNVFDNGTNAYVGVVQSEFSDGTGMLAVDPLYRNVFPDDAANWDLGLLSSSPLHNVGDPNLLDPDGTRSTIGSRGGPWATWPE